MLFIASSAGKMLAKNDTLNIKTNSESNYGSIRFTVCEIYLTLARNPVLQVIQSDKIVLIRCNCLHKETNSFVQLYKPGDYNIRILHMMHQEQKYEPGRRGASN